MIVERRNPSSWRAEEAAHAARADALTRGHRERARRGQSHPVMDFLFTYYRHRPGQLRRWHPGPGVALVGDDPAGRGAWRFYRVEGDAVLLDVDAFVAERGGALRSTRALLAATAARAPSFSCFGLHEWAMVYRLDPGDVRHAGVPLRLSPAETDAVVESRPVRCSHYDAYRFFTPGAVGLNELRPAAGDRERFEQPGCVHATMDLYRAAFKLTPAIPGGLVLDAFELASAAREIDMRASPYDLADLGYAPIAVETAAGRAEYVTHQRALAAEGALLRERLVEACDAVLAESGAQGRSRRRPAPVPSP